MTVRVTLVVVDLHPAVRPTQSIVDQLHAAIAEHADMEVLLALGLLVEAACGAGKN